MRFSRFLRHFRFARHATRQLEPDAIWIEKIDRLDEAVIGDAEHLDAGILEPRLGRFELGFAGDLEREMVDP